MTPFSRKKEALLGSFTRQLRLEETRRMKNAVFQVLMNIIIDIIFTSIFVTQFSTNVQLDIFPIFSDIFRVYF